jgi:YegS/Rv2252/BmrU family lipid kinase
MNEGQNPFESRPVHCPGRVFAILNPKAGSAVGDAVRQALTGCMNGKENRLEIHETAQRDDVGALVRDRLAMGVDLVIAAGGDGTVSAVADALAGSNTPLGIIPMGTANVLARELNIPLDLHAASQLLVGEHDIRTIDAMRVNGRHYVTQLGVGLDAMMIRDTSTEQKRRFGKVAYVWTAVRGLAGIHPHRFTIEIDGNAIETRASQVIVANVGMLGQPPFRYGPDIRLDDGRLDVCVSKARHLFHYIGLFWHVVTSQHKVDPNIRYFQAEDHVVIAPKHPLPVQADGEILGETPVRVDVVPGAIRVIVPKGSSTPGR